MLLAAIDEHHKGTYDFFYLPIDFKVCHRNREELVLIFTGSESPLLIEI